MQRVYLRARCPDQLDSIRDRRCAGPAPSSRARAGDRHCASCGAGCETLLPDGAGWSGHAAVDTYQWTVSRSRCGRTGLCVLQSLGSWPRVAGAGAQRIDAGGRWPVAAVPLPVLTVAGGMVHIHTYLRAILDDEEQVMLRYVITAPVWTGSATMPSRRARPASSA